MASRPGPSYNSGNRTADISLPIRLLGLGDGPVRVRDVWARRELGSFTAFSAKAAAHEARIFAV